MSKLRNFFGSKTSGPVADDHRDVELDDELYLTIARQFGKENESIRNLLVDAENKIKELDAIKRSISEQVDPVSKTLRVLEETKRGLSVAESKVATLEGECARLRETLTATQRKSIALESTNAGQTRELTACRTQIADLKAREQKLSAEIQAAQNENRRQNERVALAEKQKAQFESEAVATRQKLDATWQKLTASEDERTNVQKSLDQAVAELSQMAQRLRETEKAFEDEKRRYENDIALHEMNYEALKTRAEVTHKLLEETRNGMLERAKEIQSSIAA